MNIKKKMENIKKSQQQYLEPKNAISQKKKKKKLSLDDVSSILDPGGQKSN